MAAFGFELGIEIGIGIEIEIGEAIDRNDGDMEME